MFDNVEIDGLNAGSAGAYGVKTVGSAVDPTFTRVSVHDFLAGSGFLIASACTLRAVTVSDCKYGINVEANYPLIISDNGQRNSISNCTTSIFVTGYAYPRFVDVDISSPAGGTGLYTDWSAGGGYSGMNIFGGSIAFKAWSMNYDPEYFWLRTSALRCFTSYGVFASGSSIVELGTEANHGNNEFFSPFTPCPGANPLKYVGVKTPRVSGLPNIQALYNYWGSDPPSSTKFSPYVDYAPWLADSLARPFIVPTDVGAEAEASSRKALRLSRNPFSTSLTLRFQVFEDSRQQVSLRLLDVTGRLVRTVVSGEFMAGEHEAVWDGTDDAGHAVRSGIYFARLQANGRVEVTRVLQLR